MKRDFNLQGTGPRYWSSPLAMLSNLMQQLATRLAGSQASCEQDAGQLNVRTPHGVMQRVPVHKHPQRLGLWILAATGAMLMTGSAATADDSLVMTDTGAPLKVVVRQDSSIFEGPNKEGKSRPVTVFEFFYVLKPEKVTDGPTQNGFYRVAGGESKKLELGWIHKDDVVEWPHRQALGLRPVKGRERAEFFGDKKDLGTAFADNPDGKPTPISREPRGGSLSINLVPILDRFTMQADGDDVDGFHVAYLHSKGGKGVGAASVPTNPDAEGPAIDLSKATLDIMFVIDATGSMQPHINATKEAVEKIAREIAKRSKGAQVRFGLVGYRDVGEEYVAKLFCDLEKGANHQGFQRIIGELRADGGGDDPEDVFAAMKTAIKDAKWNPHAFKHIILMGDAPAHEETTGKYNSEKLTIDGVVAMAQPRGQENIREKITVHAICCKRGAVNRKAVEQFKSLAAGEEFPGFFGEFDTKRSPAFIEDLILKALAGLDTITSGGDVSGLDRKTPGLGMLLEMVNASEAGSEVPSFASGYCCEIDAKGNQVFEPYVLVQHGRLGMFNSLLEFSIRALRASGDAGSRDVKKVLQSMQIFSTQINLGEPITGEMTVEKIASLILGFPVRNKIFNINFNKLSAMTEADFTSWVQQVEASKTITASHLDNSRIWKSLGRDVPLEQRYCFLKVKDLP